MWPCEGKLKVKTAHFRLPSVMLMFCGVFVEDKKLDSKLHMWGLKRNTSVYISEKISTSVLLSEYVCSYINKNDLFSIKLEREWCDILFFQNAVRESIM